MSSRDNCTIHSLSHYQTHRFNKVQSTPFQPVSTSSIGPPCLRSQFAASVSAMIIPGGCPNLRLPTKNLLSSSTAALCIFNKHLPSPSLQFLISSVFFTLFMTDNHPFPNSDPCLSCPFPNSGLTQATSKTSRRGVARNTMLRVQRPEVSPLYLYLAPRIHLLCCSIGGGLNPSSAASFRDIRPCRKGKPGSEQGDRHQVSQLVDGVQENSFENKHLHHPPSPCIPHASRKAQTYETPEA